jgi:excisionase family DNA binding protein
VLSVAEAAELLGVSEWLVLQQIQKGELPHKRCGRRMAQRRHRTDGRADPGGPRHAARNPRPDQPPPRRGSVRDSPESSSKRDTKPLPLGTAASTRRPNDPTVSTGRRSANTCCTACSATSPSTTCSQPPTPAGYRRRPHDRVVAVRTPRKIDLDQAHHVLADRDHPWRSSWAPQHQRAGAGRRFASGGSNLGGINQKGTAVRYVWMWLVSSSCLLSL